MADIFKSVLIVSLWGSGLTILFLLFNKLLNRKLPAYWHYYIWVIVLVRLLIPTFVTINIDSKALPLKVSDQQMVNILQAEAETDINHPKYIPSENLDFTEVTVVSNFTEQLKVQENLFDGLLNVKNIWIIWFSVAVLIGLWKIISYFAFLKEVCSCSIDPTERYGEILEQQKVIVDIKSKVRVFVNSNISSPFAVGLLKSVIVLPDKQYSDTQLKYIFHHELNHIRRYDIVLKWLFEAAKTIHWFNPFVYLAAKSASFYCEASCDEAIIKNRSIEERKEYGMTVINIISHAISPEAPMSVSMSSNKSDIKKRLSFILDSGHRKRSIPLFFVMTLLTITLSACSGVRYRANASHSAATDSTGVTDKILNTQIPDPANNNTNQNPIFINKNINLLIAGMDGDGRTTDRADVIMVASLNTSNNKIRLISIPRDTYIVPSAENMSTLSAQSDNASKGMRFNELVAYAGEKDKVTVLQKEVSNLLKMPIDFYIKIDMAAFRKIVDAVGGVEMTVPEGGLHYSDLAQNLNISLDGGTQTLDGEKALMLVRYRAGYKNGDLDRINVQQKFLSQLFKKMIDGGNLTDKVRAVFDVLTNHTITNITLSDMTSYLKYISQVKGDSLQFMVLPTEPNNMGGRFYLMPNTTELRNLLNKN